MDNKNQKIKALVLMSGGLDSMLAVKILETQGVDVTPVCFESYFFSCEKAKKSAQQIGAVLRVEDISEPHLETVRRPRHGYGAGMNPCIDCHALMLKTAHTIMKREGYDLIATGEVLGQRPMSQNRQSLEIVGRDANMGDDLLRPLSAKLLPETGVEKKGLVDRGGLYGFSGRSRAPQYELAKEFGIKDIPQPAGGCLLTEPEYGKRLRKLMEIKPDFDGNDAIILRYCRPFWEENVLIAVARDKKDCEMLEKSIKPKDTILFPANFPGPVAMVRDFYGKPATDKIKDLAKRYLLQYSKKIPADPEIKCNVI